MLHCFENNNNNKSLSSFGSLPVFFKLANGTATGVVAIVTVNKSEILSAKLREETIKGRGGALAGRAQGSCLRGGG